MAADDDSVQSAAPANNAPRRKRWCKRLPPSVVYPPRRARLLVLPGEVKTLTIREAADRLARVAAEEADPEQRQTLHGKYRFMFGHALCELIRSGDFHLVAPRTMSRETFERFACWYGYRLTDDPSEKIAPNPFESPLTEPVARVPFFRTASDDELVDVEAYIAAYVIAELPVVPGADTGMQRELLADEMRDEVESAAHAGSLWLRDKLGHLLASVPVRRQRDPLASVFLRSADLEAFAFDRWDVRNEPEADETPQQRHIRAAELFAQLGNCAAVGRAMDVSVTRARQLIAKGQAIVNDGISTPPVDTPSKPKSSKGQK